MKPLRTYFIFILIFISYSTIAQDTAAYLASFDSKVYSLKNKGVKDFVVDIESSKLTKQMNEQMVFGNIKELVFKVYWTAVPERLAIEVTGLPEGFKEIKEELKVSIMSMMDSIFPIGIQDRFKGYQIIAGNAPKQFLANDQSGIAAIPSYILKFDDMDRLIEVVGKKVIGTFEVKTSYEKERFADGKWVLISQKTFAAENGQSMTTSRDHHYGTAQGTGVLTRIDISTEQKWADSKSKPLTVEESLTFKNYKINSGEALKYFLGESTKK